MVDPVATYRKQDWLQVRAESEAVLAVFGAAFAAGLPSGSAEAVGAAEQARRHIDRWFYPCSPEMHCSLADLYVTDERFAAYYDRVADAWPGTSMKQSTRTRGTTTGPDALTG